MPIVLDSIRHAGVYSYIVRDEGIIVVDTGLPGGSNAILRALTALRIKPTSVRLIILTHGHIDHAGSASALRAATGAKIAAHLADARWLARGTTVTPGGIGPLGKVMAALMAGAARLLPAVYRPTPLRVDILFGDEGLDLKTYGINGRVIHTPGHTAGSVSVLLANGDAIVGDLVMAGSPFARRPGLSSLGDDQARMAASVRRLIAEGARTFYPAHGRPFPVRELHLPPEAVSPLG